MALASLPVCWASMAGSTLWGHTEFGFPGSLVGNMMYFVGLSGLCGAPLTLAAWHWTVRVPHIVWGRGPHALAVCIGGIATATVAHFAIAYWRSH